MRALRLMLTAAAFAATFAVIGVAAAVITAAAIHKRVVSPVPLADTRS